MSIPARNARLREIWNHQDTLNRHRAALLSRISEEEHFRFATLYPLPPQDELELRQLRPSTEEVLAEVREAELSGEWGNEEEDAWSGYHAGPTEIDALVDEDWGDEEEFGVGGEMTGNGAFVVGSDDEDGDEDVDEDVEEDDDMNMSTSESEQDSETPSDSDSDIESPNTLPCDPDSEKDPPKDAWPAACLSPAVFSDGSPDVCSAATNNLDVPFGIPLPPSPSLTPSPTTSTTTRREAPAPPEFGPTSAETLLEFEMSYHDIYNAGANVWRNCQIREHMRYEAFQRRLERADEGPRGPSGLRNEVPAEEVGEVWEGWEPRKGW